MIRLDEWDTRPALEAVAATLTRDCTAAQYQLLLELVGDLHDVATKLGRAAAMAKEPRIAGPVTRRVRQVLTELGAAIGRALLEADRARPAPPLTPGPMRVEIVLDELAAVPGLAEALDEKPR